MQKNKILKNNITLPDKLNDCPQDINNKQIPTAQLFLGKHDQLLEHAKSELQKNFCTNNFCKKCTTCKQIENKQHIGCIWIKPEKNYTREQIQIIFDTIAFKLEENQKLFFIIENADLLNDSCSNSLLKSIEEPPQGYHFILLAEYQNQILPTIESRCVVKSFYNNTDNNFNAKINKYNSEKINNNFIFSSDLFKIFKSYTPCFPDVFLKTFEAENITEKDTIKFLDELLSYWTKEYKYWILENDDEKVSFSYKKFQVLKNAIEYSPMPGSNKVFWLNLYLQIF